MGGSFGRIQSSAQWGKQIDNYAVYGALEGVHDDGFRNFQTSNVRRFYGDVGVKNDQSEFHVNMGVADNDFGAAATTPAELLQQYWGATYTTPQTSTNKVGYVNFTGKVEVYADLDRRRRRACAVLQPEHPGRQSDRYPALHADPALLCFGDGSHAGQRSERRAALQSLRRPAPCSARTIEPRRRRRRRASRCRRPIPTSCSGTTIISRSEPASITASPISWRAPNWGRSAPTTFVSGSGIFLGHIRQSGFGRPGVASHHQPVHRALRARHLRRHAGVLDHRRRPLQRRQYQPAGSDRHRAERQRYLYPLQSDHRRHLQDHAGN